MNEIFDFDFMILSICLEVLWVLIILTVVSAALLIAWCGRPSANATVLIAQLSSPRYRDVAYVV